MSKLYRVETPFLYTDGPSGCLQAATSGDVISVDEELCGQRTVFTMLRPLVPSAFDHGYRTEWLAEARTDCVMQPDSYPLAIEGRLTPWHDAEAPYRSSQEVRPARAAQVDPMQPLPPGARAAIFGKPCPNDKGGYR